MDAMAWGTRAKSWVWAFAPLYSLGFGTAAIHTYAAVRKQSVRQGLTLPLYLLGLALVLVADPDYGGTQETLFSVGMTINMGLGFVHSFAVRSWVFGKPAPPSLEDRQRAALRKARAAAEARDAARTIVAENPTLARELQIGRPDLRRRHYPDGGLVDVNVVSADVLARHADISPDLAEEVVAVRDQIGGFASHDDLVVSVGHHHELDRVRDLLVFSRPG